ncbi:hypothetical protein pdul_cds_969 [Pandoravirus dulcis]|uniref:Uncharacterized protein n=1 Tax=Pandoravirus dulcis TaxID=1349409 RepID=A0A291AUB5_9VIRU|nr:hypothetical protein pdul_cds_969 [Pandoravirus dulcis]ATE82574.1 hypothetical protein pdul_cds_969 [Pandoravirus dulcis]
MPTPCNRPKEVSGVMSLDGWTVDLEDRDAEPVISWEEHLRCSESHPVLASGQLTDGRPRTLSQRGWVEIDRWNSN